MESEELSTKIINAEDKAWRYRRIYLSYKDTHHGLFLAKIKAQYDLAKQEHRILMDTWKEQNKIKLTNNPIILS